MGIKRIVSRAGLAAYALASAAIIFIAQPAAAGTIDWNFTLSLDNGDNGSGTFVTQDTPAGGPFLITSIQNGFLAGDAMTLLPPETSLATGNPFNDNLLSESQPFLDSSGLGFTAGGLIWALWSQDDVVVDSWCNNASSGLSPGCSFAVDPNGSVTSFTVEQVQTVPEPGTMALMAAGVIALSAVRRRRA